MLPAIAAFVVPLGLDTLAVAVALGLRGMRPFRPAVTFAFFEAVMPLVGLFVGRVAGERFETPAVVTGGVVLLAVAAYMFKEALENDEAELSFSSARAAALAGFGISLDELAIGFPMGTSGLPIAQTIGAIALQTLIVTYAGISLGNRLGAAVADRTSRVAGVIAATAFALLGAYIIATRFVPAFPAV